MANQVLVGNLTPGTGASFYTTDVSIEDTGEVTMPRQSAFLAYLASSDANVTGAGTTFTLGSVTALTEVFDQNDDFNTNGTFTSPITGRYHFDYKVNFSTLTAAMTNATQSIVTSNRTYTGGAVNIGAVRSSGNAYSTILTVLADMDAGDTATYTMAAFNGAGDTASAQGSATVLTYISGKLAC